MSIKISSETKNSKDILNDKYCVDYYQREYVWKREQLEELMDDLSRAFLKQYVPGHDPQTVEFYDPYYMGRSWSRRLRASRTVSSMASRD